MRILVHEWCCSGGLTAWERGRGAGMAASLHAEGRAMFLALLHDATRAPDLDVTALVDQTRPVTVPARVRIRSVPVGAEIDMLVAEAVRAEITIIVAPETDGLLASRVAAVRLTGGAVLASDAVVLAVAADKQATMRALAAAGVPVPAGRLLAAGGEWPADFVRPAIRKPRDGVGGEDIVVVPRGARPPAPAVGETRVEAFVEGVPVGVSCLCGPGLTVPLMPLRQRFVAGPGSSYVGGAPLADRAAEQRATNLAVRAIAAVTRAAGDSARGWLGVDMILGRPTDGRGDRVLEVNPRLTTSFVGHAAAATTSLVRQVIAVAAGHNVLPAPRPTAFQVLPHGVDSSSGD